MMRNSPYPKWDAFFLLTFAMFVLVAFVHEPLFYLYCGWDGLKHDSCTNATVAAIWKGYAQYDPVYFDMPRWMALMIAFDTVLLSPFYVWSVWALWQGRVDEPLYRSVAFAVCGALIYAMVLYLSWEVLEADTWNTQLLPVILYNIPWGLVPLMYCVRLYKGARA